MTVSEHETTQFSLKSWNPEDLVDASIVGEASKGAAIGAVFGALSTTSFGWWAGLPRAAVLESVGPKTGLFGNELYIYIC